MAPRVAQTSWRQRPARVRHNECWKPPSGQNIVADRECLSHEPFADALVDAFIVPANEDQPILMGPPLGLTLAEERRGRIGQHYRTAPRTWCADLQAFEGRVHDRRHHHHSRTSTIRAVVDRAVLVGREIARVRGPELCQTSRLRPGKNTVAHRPKHHLWEKGHKVDPHREEDYL